MAKNALLVYGKASPYEAVIGQTPNMLTDLEHPTVGQLADDGPGPCRNVARIRDIAVQSMVEATARARMSRAGSTQARVTGEQLQLEPGQLVDIYRRPSTKDAAQ